MKVEILKTVEVKPMTTRNFAESWFQPANAAVLMDHKYFTLYIQVHKKMNLGNGWGTDQNELRGWHFRDALLDSGSEILSYRHLIDFPEGRAKIYFINLTVEPDKHFEMMHLAKAVRDHIEMVL
jgi:hypothetical protein